MKFRNLLFKSRSVLGAALFLGLGLCNTANADLMFSYNQNLANAQPVSNSFIQARPVYFFNNSNRNQQVTIECCDWVRGPGSRTQGNVDSKSTRSNSAVSFDLSDSPTGKVLSAILVNGNNVVESEFTVVRSSNKAKIRLVDSNPVVASRDGQIIENLRINAGENVRCAIDVKGYSDVVVRNVYVTHKNMGICVKNAPNVRIEHVKVVSTSAPEFGPHCRTGVANCLNNKSKRASPNTRLNIRLFDSDNAQLEFVHVEKGSSGIVSYSSDNVNVFDVRCEDVRGPAPRGNCVQFGYSNNGYLKNFYTKNTKNVSYEFDVIAFFASDGGTVSHGLVDGSFSRNGVGVISDRGSDELTVTNVDFTNTTNAALSISTSKKSELGKNLFAENIRVRDTNCDARHNRKPSSDGLVLTINPASDNPEISKFQYWNHCRKYATFCLSQSCRSKRGGKGGSFDVKEQYFDLKEPLQLSFDWDDA